MLMNQMSIDEHGILLFKGKSCQSLAEKEGTPLYVMDEQLIRKRMQMYKACMRSFFFK